MKQEIRQCLPLKQDVIYGPVNSRRLGKSLGLNLSPQHRKICSFNCVYCHYGWSAKVIMNPGRYSDEFPDAEAIPLALEEYLRNNPLPDYITFSGNGEPSMHPRFPEIVDRVLSVRDRLAPEVEVTILSNSSTAGDPLILKALRRLDIRFMKLDCGEEHTFKLFNRPAPGITLSGIIRSLISMDMPIIIQTLLADGTGGNYNRESIEGYIKALGEIKPESVQLYSLDRPAPDGSLIGLTRGQLQDAADRITAQTALQVEIFGRRSDND